MKTFIVLSALFAAAYGDAVHGGAAAGYGGMMTVGSSMAHGAGYGGVHGAYGALKGGYAGAHAAASHASGGYGSTLGHMAAMGTAASFSGPLAVLGLLKIGAAAFMALNYFRAQNEREQYGYGYGYDHHYRHKRSAVEGAMESDPDSYFTLVSAMDNAGCGKQLICELEAKAQRAELESDEMLMISLFG